MSRCMSGAFWAGSEMWLMWFFCSVVGFEVYLFDRCMPPLIEYNIVGLKELLGGVMD